MSPTLLEALLLFISLFTTLAMIGCVGWFYRLARWWHEQKRIPRPVRVEPLTGEVHLFEPRAGDRQRPGEVLGWVRVWSR